MLDSTAWLSELEKPPLYDALALSMLPAANFWRAICRYVSRPPRTRPDSHGVNWYLPVICAMTRSRLSGAGLAATCQYGLRW